MNIATYDDEHTQQKWNAEVARLEEEIGQLRSTASWALPHLAATTRSQSELTVSRTSRDFALSQASSCISSPQKANQWSAEPIVRAASRSQHDSLSVFTEKHVSGPTALDDISPRGRPRDVKPLTLTYSPGLSPRMPPAAQVSCDEDEDTTRQTAPLETQVTSNDLKQVMQELEALELALQKTRSENATLLQANRTYEDDLQQLLAENAALREARSCREEALQQECDKLREEREARGKLHARDIAELEGMLEPLMDENSRLSKALAAAEAKFDEATAEVEPEIERSCDLDRVLKQMQKTA